MDFIDAKPFEFSDFSGGMTDHVVQGQSNRFQALDNFWITVDRKAETRHGTVAYDPTGYQLPGNSGRVANLFTAINETVLLAHANRDIYLQNGDLYNTAWSAIKGPTGNEAVSGGGQYHQISKSEFQHQIYFTSDASVLPGKLFRDQNNSWKAVTAGLPKQAFEPNYPDDSSLIAACITLANAIRTSMISHFQDAGVPASHQHLLEDKWSECYLQAVTFTSIVDPEYPGPDPLPTPAPAATDEASLYDLCLALAFAYEHHRNDLAGSDPTNPSAVPTASLYHHAIYTLFDYTGTTGVVPTALGINSKLKLSGSRVSSAAKAAAFLDELAQKWYWHQLSPFSHSQTNNYTLMSKYLVSAAKIGQVYTSATEIQVEPNYDDFVAFAKWIVDAYNAHTQNNSNGTSYPHGQDDPYGQITLPDPTDYDSAALAIFWARWHYGSVHQPDGHYSDWERIVFTGTSGSANITSVTHGGVPVTLTVGTWLLAGADFALFNHANPHNRRVAQVIASGAGTATLDRTCTVTGGSQVVQNSGSFFHGYFPVTADYTTYPTQAGEPLTSSYGLIGTSLQTWVDLGKEFLTAFAIHTTNGLSHRFETTLSDSMQGVSAINGNPFFAPVPVTLAWASFYRYQYVVEPNGILYVNEGPPIYSRSLETCPSYPVGTVVTSFDAAHFPNATIAVENTCAFITGIPALVNDSLTNYDTTVSISPTTTNPANAGYAQNLTVELYRTTDGGTTFYKLDSLTTDEGSYQDTTNESYPVSTDEQLNLQEVMYTSGGVVANDPPPECKYTHTFNGYTYYGSIVDSGQQFPQRLRQSLASAPDSAPASFFLDLPDELRGISSSKTNLIALCRASIYRIKGTFSSTGQGSMSYDEVAGSMGCLNGGSIVKTEVGVFYAGTDGFYYTDGYQFIKISLELDATYRSLTASDIQKARIVGSYDKLTRKLWWSLQSAETGADCDVFFVYYLDYGVKPSGVFTKAYTTASWMPSSHTFFKGRLIIGDSRGYLFKTDPWTKTDPKINTAVAPSLWQTTYIPWDLTLCALDMGSTANRKWGTKINVTGQNRGDAAIQPYSINNNGAKPDGSSSKQALSPIDYAPNARWGNPTEIWGDAGAERRADGILDAWRRFPSKSMRFQFKQVQLVPADVIVYKSDDYPEFAFVTVDATAKTATLQTPSGYTALKFPIDVVDYYIAFDTDEYATRYLITALGVSDTRITYSDAANATANSSAAKWQISGVKKEQKLKITSINVHAAQVSPKTQAYPGDGGNE